MAKSKYELEILGDNSKFNKTVSESMRQLDALSSKTNGFFDGIAGGASKATGALNALSGMTPQMVAFGAAGVAAGLAFKALNNATEYVKNMNEISTSTGVSIEMLQKLRSEFSNTGMDIAKFGDINKDALDKLGDSVRGGGKGGIADDIKEWGLNFKDFTQYVGDAEGGIKSVIDLFYKLKASGASSAEIRNAMESMASDSSHLMSTLQQYSSTTEALNHIQEQHAGITNKTAREYQEFEKNMDTFKTNVDELTVRGVAPLVAELNELYGIFNKEWNGTELAKILLKYSGPAGAIINLGFRFANKDEREAQEKIDDFLARNKAEGDRNFQRLQDQTAANKKIDAQRAKDAETAAAKAKAAQDKLDAQAKSAAAEAKRVQDKLIADRAAAVNTLNSLNNSLYAGAGKQLATSSQQLQASLNSLNTLLDKGFISQSQYALKRQQLVNASQEDFKKLLIGSDPEQLSQLLNTTTEMYQNHLDELNDRRTKGLIDAKNYQRQLEQAETEHQTRLDAIKSVDVNRINAEMNIGLGFGSAQDEMTVQQARLDEQAAQFQAANLALYNQGVIDHEAFLAEKEKLDTAYALRSQEISRTEIKMKMEMMQGFASGMSGIIAGIAGENSKAARASFAITKGLSIAQGLINAQEASTKAIAMYPGPIGIGMAAASYAQAIGSVMQMKNIQGQFHDGISDVPNTGTYLLESGERVVDKRLNQDLKDFLSEKDSSGGGEVVVDASINVSGSIIDGDKQILRALKNQSQAVAQIVQDANRRKM